MSAWVKALIAGGEMVGEADEIGAMFWAATHGAVVLEMSGRIPRGAASHLHERLCSTLAKGLRPEA
jgi:hypothetical protein